MLPSLATFALILAPLTAQDLSDLVAKLDHKNSKTRAEVYRELLKAPPGKVLPLLRKQAPKFGYAGQVWAMLLLDGYPADKTTPTRRKLTTCGAPLIECSCAAALWRTGEAKYGKVIAKALLDPSCTASHHAVMLGRLRGVDDPAVLAALRDLLSPTLYVHNVGRILDLLDDAPVPDLGKRVDAMVSAKECPPATLLIATAFQFAHGQHQNAARFATALDRTRTLPSQVTVFLRRADDLDPTVLDALGRYAVRQRTAGSVGEVLNVLERHQAGAVDRTLTNLTKHRDPAIAKLAYERMATDRTTLTDADLVALLDAKEDWRRLVAADILRRRDDNRGLPVVVGVLRAKRGPHVDAVNALGGFRHDDAVAPLIEALGHEVAAVRARAATHLASLLSARFPYKKFDLGAAGYDPLGSAEARAAGATQIANWWAKHRDER